MRRAYIVKNDELIAVVNTPLKNGESVYYGYQLCQTMNANYRFNLVNKRQAKLSRNRKYERQMICSNYDMGVEVNPGDFFIESYVNKIDS